MTLPNFYCISDPNSILQVSSALYIDTCALIDMMGINHNFKKAEINNFTNKAVKNDTVLCVSTQVYNELRIFLTNSILGNKEHRKKLLEQDAQAMKKVYDKMKEIKSYIENDMAFLELEYNADRNFCNSIDELIKNHNIEFGDAVHYYVANMYGINSILTSDTDFMRISDEDLQIFTTTREYEKLVYEYGFPIMKASGENEII